MGHIGLTPQSVNQLGGFRVQGRNDADAADSGPTGTYAPRPGVLLDRARMCASRTRRPTSPQQLQLPTIGIGAGAGTDGQVLVLQDLWGVDTRIVPAIRTSGTSMAKCVLTDALDRYDADVKKSPVSSDPRRATRRDRLRGALLVAQRAAGPQSGPGKHSGSFRRWARCTRDISPWCVAARSENDLNAGQHLRQPGAV